MRRELAFFLTSVAVAAQNSDSTESESANPAEFAAAVEARDVRALRRVFVERDLLEKVLVDVDQPQSYKRGFVMMNGLRGGFVTKLLRAAENGSYRFLRTHVIEGQARAVFRLLPANGQIDYHEFVVDPDTSKLRFTDVFCHRDGELLSERFRGYFAMSEEGRAVEQRQHSRVLDLATEGEAEALLARIASLPVEVRTRKEWLLAAADASHRVGTEEFADALRAVDAQFGADNPARNLLFADLHFARREFDDAAAAYAAIGARIGGDPFLDVLRGKCALAKGDLDKALDFAQASLHAEPNLFGAHMLTVRTRLRQNDHIGAEAALQRFSAHFYLDPATFASVEGFAAFRDSDVAKPWLDRLAEEAKERRGAAGRAP